MKENGREEEKRENWSPSRQKFIHRTKSLVTMCTIGEYSHQDKQNYQNQQKQLTVTRTNREEIKKRNKKGKTSNRQQEQCVRSEQCA